MPQTPDENATPSGPSRTSGDPRRRSVSILGATGSIGTQALALARANPDRFRVTALAAGGANLAALAEQVVAVRAEAVGIATGDPAEL